MNFKHSVSYLPYFLLPLLLLAVLNYWNALRSVETTLAPQAQNQLNALAGEIDARLRAERIELSRVALSGELHQLLSARKSSTPAALTTEPNGTSLPNDLLIRLTSVLKGRGHCFRLAVFDDKRSPLFQVARRQNQQGSDSFSVDTGSSSLTLPAALPDKKEAILVGSILRYSIPVSASGSSVPAGTLVADVNLEETIADAAAVFEDQHTPDAKGSTFVAALDPSARLVYYVKHDLEGKLVSSSIPEFLPIAEALTSNRAGLQTFRGAAGQDFITAYSPLTVWSVGLAVGHDKSALTSNAHRWGLAGIVFALATSFAGAFLVARQAHKKSPGIERVEEELTQIAKGQLDRRIELRSSDDARVIADNINLMTERLRAQIAREEEGRQFQSFVRLSAMLTHDLKNAIEALSLIVGNMERHFDNEQFRLDALRSLTGATDKLRGIVSRLARPLSSLSGEHPRPKIVDLIPVIKRVAAVTAEPLREKHILEMNLPPNLFVFTDPERIEKVVENLILNGLEAMANKSGKLSITAGLTARGAATFSVTDTGTGMSQNFIDNQLFRPFSTTKKRGVGLGLYTCREVVEASAGTIEVESKEGVGTTFRVVLPSASHDSRS